ncbi:MAG: GTPase Era [Sphingomonadales bacterium]|nr:GTPase Era [Sphingomonadales bacterium]
MKAGFVNIFGLPNAGKSTLLNALMEEKLAIVSPKVQTTRHRIKGILTTERYQLVFSDTPGIITPRYKLHEKMMEAVRSALEDADLALLLVDGRDDWQAAHAIFESLQLKVPAVVLFNKIDLLPKEKIEEGVSFFSKASYAREVITLSALSGIPRKKLINALLAYIPDADPYFNAEDISDLQTRFFVSELIRETLYSLTQDELPYHTAVSVREYREKKELTRITADIVVQRETQKVILIGEGGTMIKKIGTAARKSIESFIGQKVYLELFVKVKPKWRDNELYLKEYGY